MEALLGSAAVDNSCSSIEQLQDRLRGFFTTRVTDTSAEHVTQTYEFGPSVVFTVPVTDPENGALENATLLDPQLGGLRSSVATAADGSQPVRHISAIEALMNQPRDEGLLQKSVAKHIVAAFSEVDHSHWIIRGVSMTDRGWTFTYICRDSLQAWQRQHAKTPAKQPIGAWSGQGGDDPINLGRPSFDCRGQVTISFLKPTRVIEVKYEHTPLHKSVAELLELLAPELPPPPSLPFGQKKVKQPKPPKEPKPPKPPKEPKAPKTPKAPRKRPAGDAAEGDGSQPKKRRKKDSQALGPDGTVLPPEMPGALPVGDGSQRPLCNQPGANGVDSAGNYPEGLVGDDGQQPSAVHGATTLNVSPEEAARRNEVAVHLLQENNIDPQSLSADQFNIFANQSPELQQESLAMLVKYGAERLRIVHPNKNGAATSQPHPAQPYVDQQAAAVQSPSGSGKGSKAKRPKKQKSTGAAAPDPESDAGVVNGNVGATKATAKIKLTRGACEGCRLSKRKCDKEKPSCSTCVKNGIPCEYAIAKPRTFRASKAAEEESVVEEPEPQVIIQDDEPDDLPSPGFTTGPVEVPPSQLVSPPIESPADFAQPTALYNHPSGLSFPGAADVPQQDGLPNYTAPVETTVDAPLSTYAYPPPAHEPALSFPEQPAPQQTAKAGSQRSRSRRALPSGQPAQDRPPSAHADSQANSWQAVSHSPTMASAVATRTSPRQAKAWQTAQNASTTYDSVRQPSWATSQPAAPASSTPAFTSPPLAAAQTTRSKSRQSGRTQTPVQAVSVNRPVQAPASQTHATAYPAATGASGSTSVSSYDYSQYSNARAEPASNTVAYEPYGNHSSSTNPPPNSYSSYGNYNSRTANGTPSANTTLQTAASSYNATTVTAPSTTQWGATNNAQSRNTQSYNNNQASSTGGSYNRSSQAVQGFSVRPQPPAQTRSTTSAYNQAQQPQRQQPQRQQPQQAQQGYNGYNNQQANNDQQHNWYGFNSVNNSASGYNPSSGSTNNAYSGGSHAHPSTGSGSYNQTHHRSMNLSSHTYSSINGQDQALYDLLGNGNEG